MKNLSLILAMLFLAFTVEAQTVERTKRNKERKTTTTSVSNKSERSSTVREARSPASSKSSVNRSSSSSRPAVERKANTSSSSSSVRNSGSRSSGSSSKQSVERNTDSKSSSATRSSNARSSSSAYPQKRTSTTTRTSGNVSRSGSSQNVNRASSNRSEHNTGTRVVNAPRGQNSQYTRDNVYTPKTSQSHAASRKVYVNNYGHRVRRNVVNVNYNHRSLDYRRVHNPYNRPHEINIYWNANMYRNYRNWYPDFNLWYYPYGYRIHTISAYDSYSYIGEVARVYGRVSEVWYSRESNEFYLYVGGPYPYQDFTIILDERDARRFSRDPERYFSNRHISATGLVSMFEDKPEMLIRKRSQISLY